MAKAGARYEVETGNIWGYAHRGDLTGVRAALERGVQPNLLNVAGWSASHAAAAAGHTKVLSCLLRAGADVSLRDRGGGGFRRGRVQRRRPSRGPARADGADRRRQPRRRDWWRA